MYEINFHVQENSTSQGLPYDFESIMHFRHNAFSNSRQKSTIFPQNLSFPSNRFGISNVGTSLDFLHVNILYCGGKVINHNLPNSVFIMHIFVVMLNEEVEAKNLLHAGL